MGSLAAAGRFGWLDGTRSAGAAVLGEIAKQTVHLLVGRAVDDVATAALLYDEARSGQLFEMKRHGRRRDVAQLFHEIARCAALWPCHNQFSKHVKAHGMRKSAERRDGYNLLHISRIVET